MYITYTYIQNSAIYMCQSLFTQEVIIGRDKCIYTHIHTHTCSHKHVYIYIHMYISLINIHHIYIYIIYVYVHMMYISLIHIHMTRQCKCVSLLVHRKLSSEATSTQAVPWRVAHVSRWFHSNMCVWAGVATISSLLKNISLFCRE